MSAAKSYAIPKRLVWEAYLRVKENGGSAGVDGQTVELFAENLKNNLYRIWNRMSSGTYFPPAIRQVGIPKRDGGKRYLGIPTVADRIAQTVVKMALEPVVERWFHPDSYGYRPKKSAIEAVGRARSRCWQFDWNEPAIGFYKALGARAMDEWTVMRVDGAALARLGAAAGGFAD